MIPVSRKPTKGKTNKTTNISQFLKFSCLKKIFPDSYRGLMKAWR